MKNYKVFDVGDALFSIYIGENDSKSVFDFGCSSISNSKKLRNSDYVDAETFVISHFHRDHYNIFYSPNCKNLALKTLVIPELPKDPVASESILAFMTTQLYLLGEDTGIYEADLYKIIRSKSLKDFKIKRVKMGCDFGASGEKFNVLWPDINLNSSSESIEKALKKFQEVISNNIPFRDFYERVKKSKIWKEEDFDSDKIAENNTIFLSKEEKKLLIEVNWTLIRVANDYCLAFKEENNKLLFWGDVSNRVLNKLFRDKFTVPVFYNIILSAHHGTHFSIKENWKNVKAFIVVSSGGIQRLRGFRGDYLCWSRNQHHTYCKGTFDLMSYL